MAVVEYEFTLKWENDNFFELTMKEGGEDVITVVRVEENGRFEQQKAQLRTICQDAFNAHLEQGLTEMSA